MITIIFAVFAVICLVVITVFVMEIHRLQNEVEEIGETKQRLYERIAELREEINDLQSKLAFAGKDYIEMRNKLNDEIRLLKTKINDKNNSKKKARQTVESKNKRSRKLPGMRKKGVS